MSVVTRVFKAVILSVFVLCLGGMAMGQDATTGSISGTVTDSSGALVAGAKVVLTNTDRNQVERTLTTNKSGFYTATSLPLGNYTVTTSDATFATVVTSGIYLHVADALTVNASLKPSSTGETVNVTDQAPSINLTDATSAGLINSTQLSQLVLVTRNYAELLTLQPGVAYGGASDNLIRGPVGVGGGSSTVNFSVNGGRNTSNNWTIDGADNLDRGANLTLYVYPSLDSISEFKTLRGQYSAEYGRNASGQIDVSTKSGTNTLHGSVYEYLRNDAFDAAGYLNDYNGTKKAAYRYNDFGFSVGGPVWIPKLYNGKSKTFFFVSENWVKEIADQNQAAALVPTAEERAGNFSNEWYLSTAASNPGLPVGTWTQGPVNVCTAYTNTATSSICTGSGTQVTTINGTAQQYLKDLYSVIPVPNETYDVQHGYDPHTILSKINNSYPNLNTVVRIDEQVSSKFSVFYRYIHDTFPEFVGSGTFVSVPIPGLSGTVNNNPGTQQLGKGTYAFSPTLLMNLGYAYSNGSIYTYPQGALQSSASPDINIPLPYKDVVGLIPTIGVSGLSTLGGGAVYTDHGVNHQAFGDLTKVFRNHTFIVGASIDHYEKQENNASSGNQGSFSFTGDNAYTACPVGSGAVCVTPPTGIPGTSSSLAEDQAFANFLTGNANGGFSQASTNDIVDINQYIFDVFLQDNWKVTPRLTLNLGARYSYLTPYIDEARLGNNFNPATYSPALAPNLQTTGVQAGLICGAGSGTGFVNCPVNAAEDYVGTSYINGMIFGYPTVANNNQASPYGNVVNTVQKVNLAPRFGWSYDLFGDGKVAFRGGYGWSYDSLETSYWETTDYGNPPAIATYSQGYANFSDPTGGATSSTKSTAPGSIEAVPLHVSTPYVQQYSMDIQQQFTPSFTLDLGYFGTHGTHLAGGVDIDQAVPNAWRGVVDPRTITTSNCNIVGYTAGPGFISTACDNILNLIKPYIGYNAINAMRTIFNSNYNGLQAKVTKKFSGKSYIDSNFTWSRDLTNSTADYSNFIENIYNANGDYGRATDDRKLVLTVDGVFELPWYREQHGLVGRLVGGWEISGIYAANSGLPLTATASGGSSLQNSHGSNFGAVPNNPNNVANDNQGIGILGSDGASLRPNQVANPNVSYGATLRANKKPNTSSTIYFNTGAFQATDPSSLLQSTEKRGAINGPGFQTLDVGIFRNFRIYNRLTFTLRGEAFNVANHTNVQTIGTTSTSSTFGEITGYRDARQMQVSGRFDF